MYLDLPEGAVEIEVPTRLEKLIPPNYAVESCILKDGTHSISIIKIRSVTCKINEADYSMSDNELQNKIIAPMSNNLNRI